LSKPRPISSSKNWGYRILIWIAIIIIIAVTGLGIGLANDNYHQFTVLWKDDGIVSNLHLYTVQIDVGEKYQENMIIETNHHGAISFDTANMCEPFNGFLYGSCSARSVAWDNGTSVFIWKMKIGYYVGAIVR